VPFWSNEQPLLVADGVDSVAQLGLFLQQTASPEYFGTMGTRILRGRAFDDRDVARSQRVMIVGERMAEVIWRGQDPIGKCVRYGADTAPCVTVVGVAEEMRQRTLTDAREFSFYIPATQYGLPIGTLFIRVDGNAGTHAETIRKRLQALMPGASYITAVPLTTHVEPMTRSWRFGATVFLAFGALALILAGLGTYSVIAYTVAERRREIGVRMALGATRREVVRLVVGSGLSLTAGGILVGGVIAALAARWLAPLLFQHSPWDPAVLGAVVAVLVGIGIVATAVPAFNASRVDPNVTLRSD
jgi:hypothetical protein